MVLSVINQYMDAGFAGQVLGVADGQDIESFTDNAENVNGVYDIVLGAVGTDVDTFAFTIYGIPVSVSLDPGDSAAAVRDALEAAAEAIPALVLRATFVDSGNNLRITELDAALYGPANITDEEGAGLSVVTVTEHSERETVRFGAALVQGPNPHDARLPDAGSVADDLIGFACHQHNSPSSLDPNLRAGYPPFSSISVMTRGRMYGVFEDACDLSDTVYMRIAAGAGGSQRGALRTDADGGTAVSLAGKVKIRSVQPTPGEVVELKVNLVP